MENTLEKISITTKMKKNIFTLFVILMGFLAYNVYSQDGLGSGINNIYDVNTVETISGEVTSVDNIKSENTLYYGVHITMYSINGQIVVHLGPSWFVENQDVQIAVGDYVIATGSRVTYNENQVIIAKEVMKENNVLLLRDDKGYPLWAAMPNR